MWSNFINAMQGDRDNSMFLRLAFFVILMILILSIHVKVQKLKNDGNSNQAMHECQETFEKESYEVPPSDKIPSTTNTFPAIDSTQTSAQETSGAGEFSSSMELNDESKSKHGIKLGELVTKVLESDENLQILVSLGMKAEFNDYFNVSQLKKFDMSSEMEKEVAAELKRICVEISRSERKMKKLAKEESKKTIAEKKEKFKEEYGKGGCFKRKTTKKVRIQDNLNEVRFYNQDRATDTFQ